MKSLTVFPLLVPFAYSQLALDPNPTQYSRGTGPGPYPYGDIFAQANQYPNATGSVNINGVNISRPSTQAQPISWLARINITDVSNLNYTSTPSDIITNTVISLDPQCWWLPAENTEWDTTVIVFWDVRRNATVEGQEDDGDCMKAFGAECVGNYTAAIAQARGVNASDLIMPVPPASCEGRLSVGSIMTEWETDLNAPHAFLYDSSPAHNASNTTYYDEATTRIWPIVLMQGPKNGSSGITSTQMGCLRANMTKKGSRKIGDVPAVARNVRVVGWMVIGTALMVGGLLM